MLGWIDRGMSTLRTTGKLNQIKHQVMLCALPWWVLILAACVTTESIHEGTHLARTAEIHADVTTVAEILEVFRGFEDAVRRGDLPSIMALYAEGYVDRGYTKVRLREEWTQILQRYHQFSIVHIVTRIAVDSRTAPSLAWITCTGSLSAVDKATGRRVNLDQWLREVHFVVYERGSWRIQGSAWEVLLRQRADDAEQTIASLWATREGGLS